MGARAGGMAATRFASGYGVFLWLCLLVANVSAAPAEVPLVVPAGFTSINLRPQAAVFEDRLGTLGIEEVSAADFAPRFAPVAGAGDLNFGFSRSAFWLRLRIQSAARLPRDVLLEIDYPSLDCVDFYTEQAGALIHYQAGDNLPFATRPYVHRNLVFPLELSPDAPRTIYLRVAAKGSLTVPLKLWTEASLHQHDEVLYSLHALYFGMLLALGLYNLLVYLALRDDVYLAYVGYLSGMAVALLGMLGLGHQFLWPALPWLADKAVLLGFSVSGMFGALCAGGFLDTRLWAPRLDRLFKVIGLGFLFTTTGVLFEDSRPFAITVAALAPLSALVMACGGLLALRAGRQGALLFVLAFGMFILGVAISGLRTLGLIPSNLLSSYALQLGSALEMLLLSFALASRIQTFKRETAEALRQRQEAMLALTESERQIEARIAARTAELASANARLQQSQDALHQLAMYDPLTGLSNRTRLYEQLSLAMARSRRSGAACAVLMIDLDGFKAANDTHGHGVGDLLLKEVATRLQRSVRSTDTVARIGGDEFVVVLEGAETGQFALGLAVKLVNSLSSPFLLDGHEVRIGASIGIALCPQHADDLEALLELADQAMYQAKRAGKGRCVLAPLPDDQHRLP